MVFNSRRHHWLWPTDQLIKQTDQTDTGQPTLRPTASPTEAMIDRETWKRPSKVEDGESRGQICCVKVTSHTRTNRLTTKRRCSNLIHSNLAPTHFLPFFIAPNSLPLHLFICLAFWAAALEGSMTYAFTLMGSFILFPIFILFLPPSLRCPAPCTNLNHKLLQQGTGIANHQMLLRLFFFPCLSFFLRKYFFSSFPHLIQSQSTQFA